MEKIYKKDYSVGPGETDPFALCRPSALLGFLQDAATLHSEALGLARDDLISRVGAVWVLSRIRYEIKRPLRSGEAVTVHTWPSAAKGALVGRDFDIFVAGELVGEAFSGWAVLDISARRPMRPGVVYDGFEGIPPEKNKDRELLRLRRATGADPAGVRAVRYSDLDINGHLNNVRYADIICDAAGFESLSGRFARAMQINFLSECLPGDMIELECARESETVFVAGTCGGARRFESETILEGC